MAEAEAKWLADSTNPMIQKKEAGGVLKVAVQGHETIVAEQGVSKQQTMSKRTAMETPEDKQRCSQRARMFHDVASDSHLMQGGGDAFVVGASAVAPPPRPPQARRVRQKSSPATWEDAFAESASESLDPLDSVSNVSSRRCHGLPHGANGASSRRGRDMFDFVPVMDEDKQGRCESRSRTPPRSRRLETTPKSAVVAGIFGSLVGHLRRGVDSTALAGGMRRWLVEM